MTNSLNIFFLLVALTPIIYGAVCPAIPDPKISTINLVVDDFVQTIAINGNPMFIEEYMKPQVKIGLGQYKYYLRPGDIISITVTNIAEWSDWNPAFILATINYVDPNGVTRVFSTNSKDWACDKGTPLVLGANKDFQGSQYWYNTGMFKEIEPTASIIWNTAKSLSATCSFKIPCA